jgi:tungstate transport system substrate-binding protein
MPLRLSIVLLFAGALSACAKDTGPRTRLVLAATTSLEDTGLLDVIVAEFAKQHPGIEISGVAVGTGQAIELGRRGDADILLSHDSAAEMKLVAEGRARERRSVMYNYFVIAGPAEDPAGVRGARALPAFSTIAQNHASFVSRGDDSGTHRRELSLWQELSIDPRGVPWYVEAGLGMGDALLLAGQKRAYILSDRATFLRFKSRIGLEILCDEDARLLNPYGVTVLEGGRAAAATIFADWITGEEAQQLIGDFGRAEFGEVLFIPSARGAARYDTIPIGER